MAPRDGAPAGFGDGMPAAPRVSVLTTTRNGAPWLGETLASVFAQTLRDFELIVVDDGSTDATPDLLAAIGDARLRVIRNDPARGIVGARNTGFPSCTAPYVAMLDHDDLSLPRRLQMQADYLDAHPGVVAVGTAVRILRDGRTSASGQPARVGPGGMRALLHLGNPLTWSSVMVRRAALVQVSDSAGPWRVAAEPADDFDLYHHLLKIGEIGRLDEVLTVYRWHARNTTHVRSAEMAARAADALVPAYGAWFGEGAAHAALLAIRHLSQRVTVADEASLDATLAVVARVGEAFASPEARRLCRGLAWSLLRSAIRSGHPGALRGRLAHAPWRPDTLVSLAAGLIRASRK